MPTLITSELLNLFPLGNQVESLYLSVLDGFMSNPVLSQLSNWRAVQASVSFANPTDAGLLQLPGTVANLCINLNLLPIIRSYNQYARPGTAEMDPLMTELLRDYVIPYWFGSPGAHVVGLDPRQVNVEWNYVPSARLVADATTYVFSYLTPPPGSPSRKVMDHNNLTITGNSTQVATLKTANSTGHLDTNITKRASITCQDFYPNILPFLQGGPMTTVGTDTISCAA